MPVWALILLALSALGFALWWLDNRTELDATERFGKALAILFILAVIVGIVLGFMTADWE